MSDDARGVVYIVEMRAVVGAYPSAPRCHHHDCHNPVAMGIVQDWTDGGERHIPLAVTALCREHFNTWLGRPE